MEEGGMKRWIAIVAALLAFGCHGLCDVRLALGQAGGGWVTLFDGSSLDNWNKVGDANWKLVDGIAQADGGSGYLVSKEAFVDYQVRIEFWVRSDGDGGVSINCADSRKPILDVAELSPAHKTGGQWNVYDITARGARLTMVLNGAKALDVQSCEREREHISLQYRSGVVRVRKVEVRRL
jgi:hypothetical protein